ncbi:diacylglycerol kinase [Desulfohalotomaculum tongense]|uniref:diacylglycerol kinase family protein n=1 Tax=Desulforadius tongensis TaxID=1216062 RepID=UPI001956EA21|nr:diacylglycerol kinase family protein [Desulforadius tongensis]MBM7855721.1 diacylglycerol kinase [Desulforadius tongensis]
MLSRFKCSLGWAVAGILYAVKTQPHMRFHLLAAVLVTIAGFWFQISAGEWLHVASAVALVWVAELVNTALECAVDMYTKNYHPLAKAAKDAAAGAVLVAAVNSLVVAGIIFLPRIIN